MELEPEDVLLLTGEADIFYFTGFYTTAKRPKQIGMTAVILTPGIKKFLYPDKWATQIEEQERNGTVDMVPYGDTKEEFLEKLVQVLKDVNARTLYITYDEVDLQTYFAVCPLAGEIRDFRSRMNEIRLVKSEEEICRLRRAAALAVDAMEYAKEMLRIGMTELEAAARLEYHMRRNGSDGVPFTMKVLCGRHSAVVTRVPGNERIEEGDLVLVDFGARCQGYASDWTRTFCVGCATEVQRGLYELVWQIERECIRLVKPGLPISALMEKARMIASEHPFGEYFNPYLGHSIGIGSQEWPAIDSSARGELKKNMVITIEPGIYLPGLGGVRIEDEILVTDSGCEILTGLKEETFIIEGKR